MSLRIRSFKLTALALLAGLAILPLESRAASPVAPTYSVSPDSVAAGAAFTLYLKGAPSGCYTSYSHQTVSVTGKRIDLGFVATIVNYGLPEPAAGVKDPGTDIVCPVYDQPMAAMPILPPLNPVPTYAMPALAAGTYEVWVTQGQECQYSTPACQIKVAPFSAGTLTVLQGGAVTYSIDPTKADAGKPFDLSLLSYQFNCGTTFDNLSAAVSGNTITLTFLDQDKVGIVCPAIYKAYGPTYKMGALKAGTYKVMAYRLPACYPCKMAGETAEAGTLVVGGDTARKGWFLKEHQVLAAKPFTMNLLNNAYGNCGTSFSHKTVAVTGAIRASFTVETDSNVRCIVDLHPYGPSFDMEALKMGVYPVYVNVLAPCQVTPPYCLIEALPITLPSDTLVVTQTLAITLSELRAQAPKVEMHGSVASFRLPQGIGGTWKTELLTVSGQRLSAAPLKGASGDRVDLDLGMGLKTGVYLLRLQAPDGETHMLPIVRKE